MTHRLKVLSELHYNKVPARLRRHPHLPQPRHQILLRPIPLHPVAMSSEQLQVVDVVRAPARLRDDVVNLQVAELKRRPAPVAPPFLLPEQHVLVLTVRNRRVNIRGYEPPSMPRPIPTASTYP